MDIFYFDNVKVEKANAMRRYRRLRHLTKLFRLVELCLALAFLSWISSRLPIVVRIAGEYLRLLLSIVVTPLFIFLLCNVIVLTLLIKSGQLSGQYQAVNNADIDIYEELLNSSELNLNLGSGKRPPVPEQQESVYQDKEMISEQQQQQQQQHQSLSPKMKAKKISRNCDELNESESCLKPVPEAKVFRRSQSENLKAEFLEEEKPCGKLRRSETDICRKVETPAEDVVVDEMSNEEFQRKIEGFIAKQVKFHQEEKLAIVLR